MLTLTSSNTIYLLKRRQPRGERMAFQFSHRLADAEVFVDSEQPNRFQAVIYPGDRWTLDPQDGLYKTWIDRGIADGNREIKSAAANVRTRNATRDFEIYSGNFEKLLFRKTVDVEVGGVPVRFNDVTRQSNQRGEDLFIEEWQYQSPDGQLDVQLRIEPGRSKWEYRWTAATTHAMRFRIRYARITPSTFFTTYHLKTGPAIYMASWRFGRIEDSFHLNWKDMHDIAVVESSSLSEDLVEIVTTDEVVPANETRVIDPSFTANSAWSADGDGTAKYPDTGVDEAGNDGGTVYRMATRHSLASLPASGVTVDQVDFSIEVTFEGAGTTQIDIHPYNDDGQADPESDTDATFYSRCRPGGTPYVDDSAVFQSTGVKTITDLGAAANSDVLAAKAAVNRFSLALHEEGESVLPNFFEEYTDGTNPPKLTVTYTVTGAGGLFVGGLGLMDVGR